MGPKIKYKHGTGPIGTALCSTLLPSGSQLSVWIVTQEDLNRYDCPNPNLYLPERGEFHAHLEQIR